MRRWHESGLLLIGDAAHAMSPMGGVGINIAIQDAIAAANVLAPFLVAGQSVPTQALVKVQRLRERAVKRMQTVQVAAQNNILSAVLEAKDRPPELPALVRWLLRYRVIRNIPARVIGYGFGRQDVET